MMPAKSHGSFRHKGKEIVSDDAATRDVGTSLPVPILFEFGSSTTLGWKEWVDKELLDTGFMESLQRADVLKAIVSSRCLSNYRDLFNLCHLVRRWCTTTHTFFLSCDVANQLLLPILGDVDPGALELSPEEEDVEAELRKRMSGNVKLSYWVGSSFKFFIAAHRTTFVTFWLCGFLPHSHYLRLSTILQHILYESCARHLAKCRPMSFAKEKYQSCPRVITDFCGRFESDFSLAFQWACLKLIDHPTVEFFDKGVGFSWRAYRSLGMGYTCADSVMGPFVDTIGTTTR
ncbi:hypothetical protein SO802_026376 [Lithocarpus litseifolius]|uniref:Aminotransferase-like plant mobile domain-containing protein n=1 Tax=Lithocarpus litseifolius TaxID=425828 RepID=A0AAW2C170_9ROSI